ncbi:MAG: YggS family pyridoxal phosphate-dependent enzyme [Alphaproteobacteria bacterium]
MSTEPTSAQPTAADNLAEVRAVMAAAARDAGRDPAEVTLVAVSKTFEAAQIQPVIAAGQRVFGENRVQEAEGKWPALKAGHPDIELHLIGPLQTNKVRAAVALFDVIETVDRPKLAAALAEEMRRSERLLRCFIQVNTGEEAQKAGVAPREAVAFAHRCRDEFGLHVEGLMCIPPVDEEPALHFALLRELAGRAGLAGLSMGMSADYPVAVAFGATHVRVGSAIFGHRAAAV